MRRPYYLIRRGEYWYYRLNRESGLVKSDGITWHTTGCTDRGDAEDLVKDLLAVDRYPDIPAKHLSFRKYANPFFNREDATKKKSKKTHYSAEVVVEIEDRNGNLVPIRALVDKPTRYALLQPVDERGP